MVRILLCLFLLAGSSTVFSQNIDKANSCFTNKDYQCALDNYLIALNAKSYKEGERYKVETRIANCYNNLKNFPKAIEYYEYTIASQPNQLFPYWDLADIYYDRKEYRTALTNYKSAYDNAIETLDKNDITWWMGNTYFNLLDYKMVIDQMSKLPEGENYKKSKGFIGDSYYRLKNYDSAVYFYEKYSSLLSKSDSNLKAIRCFAGKCYRQLGKYDAAMKCQDEAITLKPDYVEARWEKGILFANAKNYPSAIEQYKIAFDNLPPDSSDHSILCNNISNCYQSIGNYTEAIHWLEKKKYFSANKYAEYAKIASLQYGKLNKPKDAEKTGKEAINNYQLENQALKTTAANNYVKLNNICGIICLENKDTILAQQYFDNALKIDNDNFEANAGAGEIAWARKNVDEYKKYYSNISKRDFDTLLSSKTDIANVYGRAAYKEAYIEQQAASSYRFTIESALYYDSLQKEAVALWPRVLLDNKNLMSYKRYASLSVINSAIKKYSTDMVYVSDLYNIKAVITETTDTAGIRTALETGIKINPENIDCWNNLLKYYTSYNNAKGALMIDKLITILKIKKDNTTTAVAYVYKGDFLWRLEKKEEAKKAWAEALVWDANNATAKERIKM